MLAFSARLNAESTRFVVVLNDARVAARGDSELIPRVQLSVKAELRARNIEPSGETLYQLNVVVPNGVTGVVPVVICIGGVNSKAFGIAVQ
jgi:uncharacterized protein (TIGR03437 family)